MLKWHITTYMLFYRQNHPPAMAFLWLWMPSSARSHLQISTWTPLQVLPTFPQNWAQEPYLCFGWDLKTFAAWSTALGWGNTNQWKMAGLSPDFCNYQGHRWKLLFFRVKLTWGHHFLQSLAFQYNELAFHQHLQSCIPWTKSDPSAPLPTSIPSAAPNTVPQTIYSSYLARDPSSPL